MKAPTELGGWDPDQPKQRFTPACVGREGCLVSASFLSAATVLLASNLGRLDIPETSMPITVPTICKFCHRSLKYRTMTRGRSSLSGRTRQSNPRLITSSVPLLLRFIVHARLSRTRRSSQIRGRRAGTWIQPGGHSEHAGPIALGRFRRLKNLGRSALPRKTVAVGGIIPTTTRERQPRFVNSGPNMVRSGLGHRSLRLSGIRYLLRWRCIRPASRIVSRFVLGFKSRDLRRQRRIDNSTGWYCWWLDWDCSPYLLLTPSPSTRFPNTRSAVDSATLPDLCLTALSCHFRRRRSMDDGATHCQPPGVLRVHRLLCRCSNPRGS